MQKIGFIILLFLAGNLQAIRSVQQDSLIDVLIEQGTEVELHLAEDINSAKSSIQKGNTILMEVAADVVVNGRYKAIRTGSSAIGTILEVRKRRGFGRGAYLEVKAISVTCADGNKVGLYGANFKIDSGKQKKRRATILLILGVVALIGAVACLSLISNIASILLFSIAFSFVLSAFIMRGDEVEMRANDNILQAFTVEDTWVRVEIY